MLALKSNAGQRVSLGDKNQRLRPRFCDTAAVVAVSRPGRPPQLSQDFPLPSPRVGAHTVCPYVQDAFSMPSYRTSSPPGPLAPPFILTLPRATAPLVLQAEYTALLRASPNALKLGETDATRLGEGGTREKIEIARVQGVSVALQSELVSHFSTTSSRADLVPAKDKALCDLTDSTRALRGKLG